MYILIIQGGGGVRNTPPPPPPPLDPRLESSLFSKIAGSTLVHTITCSRCTHSKCIQIILGLVVNGAMRNRQFIGYSLGSFERNVRGRLFDSNGGGGGCQILFWQIIYFWHVLDREIYFHVAWAQENLFSCKHGKPQATYRGNY